ncbi:MAG: alpha/beta hydrolase [Actinomycetota bacterium]
MTLTLGYLAQVSALFAFQDALLFVGGSTPGRATHTPTNGTELIRVPTQTGETVALQFAPALKADGAPDAKASSRPSLLYFYGNGTCLKTGQSQIERLRRYGANVLAAEYVGYGMSTGKPSEAGCYATADAAYDYLLTRTDVDPSRIVSVGGSLGGAVAIDLASRRPVVGLATFMTFTRLGEVAQGHFPWVPVAPLLHSRFDSIQKIKRVECPILLVHGTKDLMIPHAMQARLASAATAPVTQVVVPEGTHNDLFEIGEDEIEVAFRQFLAALPDGSKQRSAQVTPSR